MINIDEIYAETLDMRDKVLEHWKTLKLDDSLTQIRGLEEKMSSPEFWDDPDKANSVSKELSDLKKEYKEWETLRDKIKNLADFVEMIKNENDSSLYDDVETEYKNVSVEFQRKQMVLHFRNKFDNAAAYLSINAGAGGTESNDWVAILSRMYIKWAENNDYAVEIVDELPGEEAGIKNITIYIEGLYAFGKLRGESGVHRLVRISPFDSGARRHTSFASVAVIPEIKEDIQIDINPSDLRVDTFRASGAGGQHINKTDSAIRIVHLPTNIVVQCQQERSQHKNREKAMQLLKAKLYQHYERLQQEEHKKLEAEKKDIAWGSQIRSYVFHPYNLIKDHRTGYETSNVDKIMDGYLDDYIFEYLKWDLKKSFA